MKPHLRAFNPCHLFKCPLVPCPVSRLPSPVSRRLPSPVSRLSSPVLPSPVSRLPSPVSRFPFPVSRFPVSRLPSLVSRLPSLVSRLPSPVSRLPSPVSRLPSPVSRRIMQLTHCVGPCLRCEGRGVTRLPHSVPLREKPKHTCRRGHQCGGGEGGGVMRQETIVSHATPSFVLSRTAQTMGRQSRPVKPGQVPLLPRIYPRDPPPPPHSSQRLRRDTSIASGCHDSDGPIRCILRAVCLFVWWSFDDGVSLRPHPQSWAPAFAMPDRF